MNMIVAVDRKWGIGREGRLLVHNPGDMKFFRTVTRDKVVVMGRKTLESLPGGRPLKNRVNVVLTRSADCHLEGTVTVHSAAEAVEYLKRYSEDQVFVIGGGTIYREFLPHCDTAYVTWNEEEYPADTYFPNLDEEEDWELEERGELIEDGVLHYEFRTYRRKKSNGTGGAGLEYTCDS